MTAARDARRLDVVGGALVLMFLASLPPVVHAQAAPAPSAAPVASSGKPCDNARKKVARERRTSTEVAESLARAQHARATCVSRSACARYDEAIRDTERQRSRQATRLARFELEVTAECGR